MINFDFKRNYPLKNLATMKIGGPAKYFFIAQNEKNLIKVIKWAEQNKVRWYIVGEGSNLIPSDEGFNGLIIKNKIENFKKIGNKIYVGAGNNLLEFILKVNKFGLAGIGKMAGIPGTIGGAIYGCAGAYGQEIKDCLVKIKIYDGKAVKWISKNQCRFNYRESIFKIKKNWIILGAELKFSTSGGSVADGKNGNSKNLINKSKEIIKLREKKYWPGLLCPGSFFKNIIVKNIKPLALRKKLLKKVSKNKIMFGKIPAGYILEAVGAKGMRYGGIRVAKHHGNLIYNSGEGKSSEILKLAKILKTKAKRKFGLDLEEEVQFVKF
ncbi:MAG: UDP-N-acetylenolpyruvoylglucosamine reductase [Candidatus Giovannonibacteria bacterium GW2011_GWC2_44_8]|uniref:UDP-N-acetylenolpyruvoylglucosamine reductase n=1 Tax=Candidatus Giovannonibacteria bacterium GW2011_GWC2_44_8 TaxID=1618657 RepID=A0A0G1MB60_9BACT|nr:MAG: UDP-N-acetylenolpyruvoylglucosamine reductase [Candidatus Giovannonibacteria bacterium GW2011_GWC2_44_8]